MDIINRGTLPDFIFLSFIFSAFLKIKIEQEKKRIKLHHLFSTI